MVLVISNLLREAVIQNVANPRQNGRIGKIFELVEPRFRCDMECDLRI